MVERFEFVDPPLLIVIIATHFLRYNMDTKQLYLAAGHLSSTLTWQDWIHFGTGKEVNHKLIEGLVDNFINDNILNLVHARYDSDSIK
jgi:hypothetical protein